MSAVLNNQSVLAGRTALVTGASSGIGWESARLLAEQGATVLLHARTVEDGERAVDRLVHEAGLPSEQLRSYAADFTSLAEVAGLAEAVSTAVPALDLLINNAAVMAPERCTLSADGNEVSFQVNFLAAHLLAKLLRAPLTAAGQARIVNVSSSLHRTASMNWNDPNRTKKYSRVAAYAQSQLALTMATGDMAPADSGITAVSVNPGLCDTALLPLYGRVGAPAAEGAAAVVRLCLPDFRLTPGAYYDGGDIAATAAAAQEERSQRRLAKLTDLLVTRA
ncbi:NAD(P)-dependent dehydrogenase (short-subunit alcohol dehydrogenase family) [Kitasatospora sp. GAS204A]|uniref:SDR family NAD(P)-dependent oxidoreductase n=1 Tax=unclassified Kitasatospora TaxID=2633591 RepID=UPI00247596FA|nr:SDR family NAD(P)-dependent oxidoreductase [Kitasatospora sp. GAS204B]MDH6121576.1 NAD(P)-dependent dehydrogenase (short-subunit alcohol dehydrogenase family) [Kitasatospora sp. GAS204B]